MILEKKTEVKNQMPEKEYRQLRSRISSSDIRMFIQSRKKFYRSCVLSEIVDNDDTVSTILGNIADCLLTCSEQLDNKFVISTAGIPGGQMGLLCEELYKRAKKGMRIEEDGSYTQTESFEVMFSECVEKLQRSDKFKGKTLDKVVELFTTPDKEGAVGELYYKEKLAHIGKTVVDMGMMISGENKAKELRESPYTADIINSKTEGSKEVFYQLVVLFTYKDVPMRAMLDKVEVDHERKTIQPIDIKTTHNNESFDIMYIKGLYIQAAVYDSALHRWKKEHELDDYDVLPIKYPVADTQNENTALLYQLTEEDIRKAYSGFSLKGSNKWHKGLNETIEDIKWHVTEGIWNISREAYQKGGKLYIELEYQ